jgi:hypothetical protein
MSQRTDQYVNIILTTKDQTARGTRSAKKGVDGLKKSVELLAKGYAAFKVAQQGIEFVKFGAKVERAGNSLSNLAKAAGTSGDAIVSSIQGASDFTIDKMSAMEAANKAMVMGVADTPTEFEKLTKVAVTLGRAMGQDATTSISDFTLAAARQSKQIADNLGLTVSAEVATARYAKELGIAASEMDDAQKKQAFFNEMMRQGEIVTASLGDSTGDSASDFEKISAALKDAKSDFALIAAEYVTGTADADKMAAKIRGLATTWEQASLIGRAWAAGIGEVFTSNLGAAEAFGMGVDRAWRLYAAAWEESNEIAQYAYTTVLPQAKAAIEKLPPAIFETVEDLGEMEQAFYTMGPSADFLAERLAKIEKAADDLRISLRKQTQGLGMDFTSRQDDIAKAAEDFAEKREKIEADHQAKMETIRKKGQSHMIKVDEAAEWDKLAVMEERLEIALQRQAEFTDKTSLSSRMAKDLAIRQLQGQIANQKALLDDFYNGRLIKQGQNIGGLLSAERGRYAEELRLLEKSRVEQEAEQRESLGRMMLNEFTAWAELKEVAPDAILDMRLDIMKEYGLIDSAGRKAAADMVIVWNKAISDFGGDMQLALNWWNKLEEARARYIENLQKAAERTYDIRVNILQNKLGINVGPGAGAVPGSGSTTTTTTSSTTVDSHDTFNVNDTATAERIKAQRRRDIFAGFEGNSM